MRPGGSVSHNATTFALACDERVGEPPREMMISPAQCALLLAAGLLAWRPIEVFPWSAVLTASILLALTAWGWRRTPPKDGPTMMWTVIAVAVLLFSGLVGSDPSAAISGASLVAGMVTLLWLASREAPPVQWPAVLALLISGLSIWGVLQLTAGPEYAEAILLQLPEPLRAGGSERLAAGRAFASQPLPSHLAILLATALPLLLARVRWRWNALPWFLGVVLCVVGLALTRSPIGVGLALVACTALAVARGGRSIRLWLMVVVLALVFAAVVVARSDVLELEPVTLRLDNWHTAIWVWSTSPAVGVGFGGFGQVAQTVPFSVGNRPRFAHSLPMEWLAELGPLGLLAVLAGGYGLWRLVRSLWPCRPDLAVAVAVVPAHNIVDFSMHGSGVLLPWAVLVGWAIAFRRGSTFVGATNSGRPVVVVSVALALAATILHATSVTVLNTAIQRAEPEERFQGALEARQLAPWWSEPLSAIAVAALESGDREKIIEASAVLEKGLWLRPRSASLADLRGHLAEALGDAPSAVAEAWTAQENSPFNQVYRERASQLFDQLQDHGVTEDR